MDALTRGPDGIVRIRNYSYAVARLLAFGGALGAFALIGWLVASSAGGPWWHSVLALSIMGVPAGGTLRLALGAAWRIDIAPWGVRVRFLLGPGDFRWADLAWLRLGRATTYVDRLPDIPLLRHRILELKPAAGHRIVVVLNRREARLMEDLLGQAGQSATGRD